MTTTTLRNKTSNQKAKMTTFYDIPCDVQKSILDIKEYMETKDIQGFSSRFSVKILSTKMLKQWEEKCYGRRREWYTKYAHRVLVCYKPSQKYFIIPYTHSVKDGGDIELTPLHIADAIHTDCRMFFEDGWAWDGEKETYTYNQYMENHSIDLTFKKFCQWKRIAFMVKHIMDENTWKKFLELEYA
jgi:hypothetical protein